MTDDKKACFVIAPIGEEDSETRRRSDIILQYIIRPAAAECGYDATRADEINRPGIITSQVIQRIVEGPLVIADLTEKNPNVYYELAIRHAIRKPFIQLIDEEENIPFDVSATRTIFVDHRDLEKADRAKKDIIEQIRSLESDPSDLETPISLSLDIQHLRRSENPGERSLADVLSELASIRSELSDIEEKVSVDPGERTNRSAVRLLEERLSNRIDDAMHQTRTLRKSRRIDLIRIIDLVRYSSTKTERRIGLPVLLSLVREDTPWIYELGMEVYRQINARSMARARQMADLLFQFIESTTDIASPSSDLYSVMHEIRMLLDDLLTAP